MVIQNYLIFWHKADDGESLRAIESGDVCFIFSKWHGATAIIVPLSQFPSFDLHCSIDTSGAVDMICPGRLDSRELRRICHLGILKSVRGLRTCFPVCGSLENIATSGGSFCLFCFEISLYINVQRALGILRKITKA